LLQENDHARRFEIASEREQILRAWGNQAAALRELHVMRRAAQAANDRTRLAQAYARMARFDLEVGRATRARAEAGRALELSREVGDRLTEIEALRVQALILQGAGEVDEALARITLALALCEPSSDRDKLLARASVMRTRGTILMQIGSFRDALDAFAEAMVIYRRLGSRRMEAATLGSLGMVSVGLGEYEEALSYYKRALAIDQEIGNRVALGAKLASVGQACLDLGDFERAERYLRKAIEIHAALGERSTSAGALITLGQLYLRRGEPAQGRVELDRGLAIALESSDRYQEIRALVYLALAHLSWRGSEEAALEMARRATRLAQAARIPQGQAWGLAVEGQALAALGRTQEAIEQSREAVRLLDSGPHFQDREQILHFHARVLARAGDAEAPAVLSRAWEEVQAKARRIRNRELRERFLATPPASEIVRDYEQSC
jgi:tetratricopeptide (TPR) repeat protein